MSCFAAFMLAGRNQFMFNKRRASLFWLGLVVLCFRKISNFVHSTRKLDFKKILRLVIQVAFVAFYIFVVIVFNISIFLKLHKY